MNNQIDTQEIIKKEFLNIFEISQLFSVSGITARRHIKEILEKIDLLENKLKLSVPQDKPPILQELGALLGKARKRVIGQTQAAESMYILELSRKEAFANWELRPSVRTSIPDAESLSTQSSDQGGDQNDQGGTQNWPKFDQGVDQRGDQNQFLSNQKSNLSNQNNVLSNQKPDQGGDQTGNLSNQIPDLITQKPDNNGEREVIVDAFAQKYIRLLETQLEEKDATIKDLRETNKFLSITNNKLNEQLRFLLEKPKESDAPEN
jgi:hypothetical protein